MDRDSHRMGLVAATAMSVTIVVGAGLLTLPGLSYAQAGRLGHLPWLLMSVLMLPLLAVFAFFARRHPSAGGVVGYIRLSLGPQLGAASEAIVIGTFSLGLPAVALIGATYLQQTLPDLPVAATAIGMVTIGLLFGMFGLRVSGAVQTAIATLIVLGLLGLCAGYWLHAPSDTAPSTSLLTGSDMLPMLSANALLGVLSALPLVLFAYTGWEITAFLAEDMQDPARNLPRSIWASFVIVTLLYVFVAWTVASAATADEGWRFAPIARLADSWLGVAGLRLTGIIATLLILANVTGAFLSTSRALFSAGRDGLLPQALAHVDQRGLPVRAMLTWLGAVRGCHSRHADVRPGRRDAAAAGRPKLLRAVSAGGRGLHPPAATHRPPSSGPCRHPAGAGHDEPVQPARRSLLRRAGPAGPLGRPQNVP